MRFVEKVFPRPAASSLRECIFHVRNFFAQHPSHFSSLVGEAAF